VPDFVDADLREASFCRVLLDRSQWRGVVLQDVKMSDMWVERVDLSGHIDELVVNGVDVTGLVNDELDRRHPERRLLTATDADGQRRAWTMIQEQADATVERARTLPAAALDESVDGEFSFLQTLRHLVYAVDRWITGPVLADPEPFHPLGQPHDYPGEAERLGLQVDARPSLDEVLEVRRERMAQITNLLRDASDDDLARVVDSPNGGTTDVMSCIRVVLEEEWAHNEYAVRDLDILARNL